MLFRVKSIIVFSLILLLTLCLSGTSFAATIDITAGTYNNITWLSGNTYRILGNIVVYNNFTIQPGVIVDFQGAFKIECGSGISGVCNLAINGNSGAPVSITRSVGGNYNAFTVMVGSNANIQYTNFSNGNFGLIIRDTSTAATVNRCNFSNVGIGIVLNGALAAANISYSTISATNRGIFASNYNAGNTPHVSFCNISATNEEIYFSEATPPNRNLDFELNYYPVGLVTGGTGAAKIDTYPYLLNDPLGINTSPGTATRIQGGASAVINFNKILPGNTGVGYRYYRVDGGNLTVDGANGNLILGRDYFSGAIVGGTALVFNTTAGNYNLQLTNGGDLSAYGDTTTHRSLISSYSDVSGGGTGPGHWGNINVSNTSTVYMINSTISCATNGLWTSSSLVTLDGVYFTYNTTGLNCQGSANPVINTCSRFLNNTYYINSDSSVTINGENVWYGSNPPLTTGFSGTGVIDYEVWSINDTCASSTSLPPVITALPIYPPNGSNLPSPPTDYTFSGTDIGMHGDSPVEYQVRLSTVNTFITVDFDFTTGRVANGTFNYPTVNVLEGPGLIYYWQVRGRDPDGTNTWGVWSPTWNFTIQGPSINIEKLADVTQAGAGDIVNYTVSFNNTGGVAINNNFIDVLPTDVYFNNTGASIQIPANAANVTFSAWDANTGGTRLGYQVLVPNGGPQGITWADDVLTAAEALQVRRIEIEVESITQNVQGYIYFRTNVR
ncbi:hypothetical protein ACFL5G_01270 [Candidatus Margulisiibacteriota bacterium]